MAIRKADRLAPALSLLTLAAPLYAADWPTYLHDNARSAIGAETLGLPLAEQWTFTTGKAPQPAWSDPQAVPVEGNLELPRVRFDDAYHAVVAGGALYFGSSADGKVYSLDAATGTVRWTAFTGGPVRLAPTVEGGRVYVGSDDGCIYCLDAANGRTIWEIRPGPRDERLLARGKMVSVWPCRTGVLVDKGVAYFGAGVFPAERVMVCAVRADDGSLIWRNDTVGDIGGGRDGFSPQGYPLASDTTLYVPSGRSLPAAFDRKDGRYLYQREFSWRSTGLLGGSYALLSGKQLYVGTEQVLGYDRDSGNVGFAWFPGRRLVIAGGFVYLLSEEGIAALDLKSYPEASRRQHDLENKRASLASSRPKDLETQLKALVEEGKQVDAAIAAARPWQCRLAELDSLILAGGTLFAGGDNRVVAVDAASGEARWTGQVDGKARGLTVADGRLFVSTDKGAIHCFGTGAPPGTAPPAKAPEPYPEDELTAVYEAAAGAIVSETGVKRGFCLVLGCGTGRLAAELAKRTDLTIYGIDPDAARVETARKALDAAGLYGTRVWVDRGDPSALPYTDYFANLVVSDEAIVSGQVPGSAAEALRVLKPIGGTIYIGQPTKAKGVVKAMDAATLRRWLGGAAPDGFDISDRDGTWAKFVRGPLPGAGSWTHQYGRPGNEASSEDQAVKCPLGVLWYGDPGPDRAVNRHLGTAAPLSVNGRVFLQGTNLIMCFDAYNGLTYWERRISGAYRVGMVRECSNLAADDDSLFVATSTQCLRLDAATGETRATYDVPPTPDGAKENWAYVAVADGLLFGSTAAKSQESDAVFAVDVATGERVWVHRGNKIRNNSIAISGGRVFFADNAATAEQRTQALRQKIDELKRQKGIDDAAAEKELASADVRMAVALDAKTGQVRWERPVDLTDCGGAVLSAICHDGVLLFCGAHSNGHYWPQFLGGDYAARRVTALSAEDGSFLWSKAIGYRIRPLVIGDTLYAEPWAFDIHTGEQKMRANPVTGQLVRWEFERPGHHCGTISGSPNALFFRSGCTAYYDLVADYGTNHFGGQRPGCWINMIPANGLVVIPEASSGCVCLFSVHCTLVLKPREENKAWGLFDAPGDVTPVKHIAVNLGAPGDRKDDQGTLWLGYPRPSGRMLLRFSADVTSLRGGGYLSRAPELADVQGTDAPWLFASGASGLTKCALPLVGPADGPAVYTVRLGFADADNARPGARVFDVKLQGKTVESNLDIVRAAGGQNTAVVREFTGVEVKDNLVVELVPKTPPATIQQAPLLNTIEVVRTRVLHVGLAAPSFLLSDLDSERAGELKLANRTGQEFVGTVRLRAPDGFAVSPATNDVTLAADAAISIPVTARVAKPGAAGNYRIAVQLVRQDGSAEASGEAPIEYLGPRARVTVKVAEDAYVSAGAPAGNYGPNATLLVDGGANKMGDESHNIGYLKFRFDVRGKPVSATLRIHTANTEAAESGDSGRICVADQPWEEYKVSYAGRPKPGKEVARLGRVDRDAWVERRLDVDLTGKSALSLVLEPTSTDGAAYFAREGGHAPELVIEYVPAK